MKKMLSAGSAILLFTCALCLVGCSRVTTVKVKANKKVVDLVKTWDSKTRFYTSKNNPLKSIEGLKQAEIACWPRELAPKIQAFYDAAEIKKEFDYAVQVIGPDNPVFAMERGPRLYLTSSKFEPKLKEAAKVEFSE